MQTPRINHPNVGRSTYRECPRTVRHFAFLISCVTAIAVAYPWQPSTVPPSLVLSKLKLAPQFAETRVVSRSVATPATTLPETIEPEGTRDPATVVQTPLSDVQAVDEEVAARSLSGRDQWLRAQLAAADARIEVARAASTVIRDHTTRERELEQARLRLAIAEREHRRFVDAESQRRRSVLVSEAELAKDRYGQLKERLSWSEKLANDGLISQAVLEMDQAALEGARSELRAAEDRLTVFDTVTHERDRIKLETAISDARADLELLERSAAAEAAQNEGTLAAAEHALAQLLAEARRWNSSAWKPIDDSTDSVLQVRHNQKLAVAESELRRAEADLKAHQSRARVSINVAARLLKRVRLELKGFTKGRQTGVMHDLTSRLRSVAESLAADQQQLAWSRRVFRKGYITPSQLRKDQLAVEQSQAELDNVQQQKFILSNHTLERDEYVLSARLDHAENELDRQERLAAAQAAELTSMVIARKKAVRAYLVYQGRAPSTPPRDQVAQLQSP